MSLQRHVKAICVVRQTANTWFRALKLNLRTLWSRFIAVGKIRKGKAGQRFKEEMPSAKPGHLSFLSKHGPKESGWDKGSYSWIKIYFNSKAGWGRIGPGSLSHLYFSLWKAENAIRMLVPRTCVWMFSWARQRKKRHTGGGDAQRMHLPLEGLSDEHCRALFLYLIPLETLWDGFIIPTWQMRSWSSKIFPICKMGNIIHDTHYVQVRTPGSKFWMASIIAVQSLSCVWLFVTPRMAACQASLSFTISQSQCYILSKWQSWALNLGPGEPGAPILLL